MIDHTKIRCLSLMATLMLVLATLLSACSADTNNPTATTTITTTTASATTTPTTVTTTTTTTASTPPATSVNAASIYSSVCGKCHGFNREGGVGSPITMNDLTGRTVAELTSILANHPADNNLTAAQREELATWLKSTP